MQHFVNNLERYTVNQIIHVSWEEFQQDLKQHVSIYSYLKEFISVLTLSYSGFYGKFFESSLCSQYSLVRII